ncbi:MAG TPA: kelch repeat-containing protein, partial [Chitinophagaceae bacterium]|nr:kelch repeat-containing protein [Chitinophagaceae bacterium]
NDFWQFNPAANQWAMRPSLPVARGKAASFVITPAGAAGECVYVVGGNALFGQTAYLNDCYKFDPAILTWTGGPALPGYARENIIAFSANNKGYAGFGESTSGYYNDLYMFDGNANGVTGAWSLMPKLTAGGRTASSAFAIGGSGYIVGGRIATGLTSETWSFNTETNTWAERANSDVGVRNGASGFTVNGEGYIAGGYDGGSSGTDARSYGDFFRYDAGAGTWSKVNGINGNPFVYAPSFVIHNIAYIFMANPNGDGTYLLWSYDPATNLWSQRSTLFYGCDAFFCINDIAYGISTSNGYLTAYDPGVNGWAYKASFPGLTQDGGYNRSGGIAFAVNGKGYYGLGRAGNTYAQDIWQYNPATDEWQQKSDFAGGGRANAVSFSVDNIAYVGTGNNSEAFGTTDFWKYNDAKDTWERVADFIGGPRQLATSFVVDKKAYVGTGDDDYMNVANPVGTHKDFYEYTPAGSTLPVSIINFTAKKQGAGVVLSWQTTYEQNTASFIIERSTDGNLFTNIGNVKAAGNSAVVLSYSYMDLPGKWPANKLYYRIKETDVNGRVTNTNIAMVSVSNQIKATIYPNPVKNVLYLQGENIKTVIIIDNTGREVFKQNVTGTTQVINLSSFAAGKYTLRYIAKDGSAQSESIIKQ